MTSSKNDVPRDYFFSMTITSLLILYSSCFTSFWNAYSSLYVLAISSPRIFKRCIFRGWGLTICTTLSDILKGDFFFLRDPSSKEHNDQWPLLVWNYCIASTDAILQLCFSNWNFYWHLNHQILRMSTVTFPMEACCLIFW